MSQASALADALTAAVQAYPEDRDEACARLARHDPVQVRVVTGAVVRALLEHRHPGGLTGDDVGAVLRAATAPGTDPAVDPELLLLVLTGALGLLDVDDQPATLTPEAAVRHTVALLAVLLGPDPLAPWLGAALAERHRAETVEMP